MSIIQYFSSIKNVLYVIHTLSSIASLKHMTNPGEDSKSTEVSF